MYVVWVGYSFNPVMHFVNLKVNVKRFFSGCGHCKSTKPHFTAAAEELKDETKVSDSTDDCTFLAMVQKCRNFARKSYVFQHECTWFRFVSIHSKSSKQINYLIALFADDVGGGGLHEA